jgi:hypothetical protein
MRASGLAAKISRMRVESMFLAHNPKKEVMKIVFWAINVKPAV